MHVHSCVRMLSTYSMRIGHTAVAELLVASGADVNTPTGSCRHEKEKDNSLLQGKRDEDDDDDEARSPLMLAVVGRLHNLIPALLTAGADPLWVSTKV